MKLRYSRRAVKNLNDIADYLNERNPRAAVRVRQAIEASLSYLADFPYAGRRQATDGIRRFVTRKYFYIAYYTIDEAAGTVFVVSIKHPARKREHEDA